MASLSSVSEPIVVHESHSFQTLSKKNRGITVIMRVCLNENVEYEL